MAGLVQTVEPAIEPVSVQDVREYLHADAADDPVLQNLIVAARRYAEDTTGRQFIDATWQLTLDGGWGGIEIALDRPPLSSVTSVQYVDTAGDTQTLAATEYDVDTNPEPGRIVQAFSKTWPSVRGHIDDVTITYVAGYGTLATDVPEGLRQMMRLLVGNWFENREATISGTIIAQVPLAVESLLWQHRILSVA